MKKLFPLFILILLLPSCGGEETTTLDVTVNNAYVYDIGDGTWELNASSTVKGFQQSENNGTFTASITYDVDIVSPSGKTEKSLLSKTEDKSGKEKISDIVIEPQLTLDSSYTPGKYTLVLRVKDLLSEQSDSSSTEFEITWEEEI